MSELREMWDTTHSFLTIWHSEMMVFKIVTILYFDDTKTTHWNTTNSPFNTNNRDLRDGMS